MPRLSLGSENSSPHSKRQHSRERQDQDERLPEKRRRSDSAQDSINPETWVDVFMGSINKKITGKRLEKILWNENMQITAIQWLSYKFKPNSGPGCQAIVTFVNNNDAQKCIRRWHRKSFGWNEDFPMCVSRYRPNKSTEVCSTYLPETTHSTTHSNQKQSNHNQPVYERKSQENDVETPKTICRTIYTPVNNDVKSVDNSPARDTELQSTSVSISMPSDLSAETRAVAKKIKIENQEFNKRIIKQKDDVIKVKDDTIDMKSKIINSKNTVIKKKDEELADSKMVTAERDQLQFKFEQKQVEITQHKTEIDRLREENRDLKLAQLSELKACHEEITEQHETNTNLRAEVKDLKDQVEVLKSGIPKMETEGNCSNKSVKQESSVKSKSEPDDSVDLLKKVQKQNNMLAGQVKFLAKENSDMNSTNIQKCMNYASEISGLEQSLEDKKFRISELEAQVESKESDLDAAKRELERIEEEFIGQKGQMIEMEQKQTDSALKLEASEEKCVRIATYFQKEKSRIEEKYETEKKAAVEQAQAHILGTMSALIASHKPNPS